MKKLTKAKASAFKANAKHVRKDESEAQLRLLGESVIRHQEQPVSASLDLTLWDGHRRVAGVILINPDHELEVVITDAPLDASETQLITDFYKKKLSGYELCTLGRQWLDARPGAKSGDLAAKLGFSDGWISQIMSLERCTPNVKDAAQAGKINAKEWNALSKVELPEQDRLLALRLNGEASRGDLEKKTRKPRDHDAKDVRVGRIRIDLKDARAVIFVGKKLGAAEAMEMGQEAVKKIKSGYDKNHDVKTIEAECRDEARSGSEP